MLHKLTFTWIGGNTCAADHMKKTFKDHGIPYRYNQYLTLEAALNGSDFVPVEYYKISGDTYGIVKEPPRTSEYFGIPVGELWQDRPDADGYTREDRIILDHTEEDSPFAGSLLDAVEKADYYRRAGYEEVTILKTLCSWDWYRYYVLAARYNPACRVG